MSPAVLSAELGIRHRRSAPRARGGAGRLPTASQKPMSDATRPRPRTHDREPEPPATRHRGVRRVSRPGTASASRPGIALPRARRSHRSGHRHPMPSHHPTSEIDRAPPIPIAGVPFRSTRPFHASRDRVPSSFLLAGATREKALFIIGRWRPAGAAGTAHTNGLRGEPRAPGWLSGIVAGRSVGVKRPDSVQTDRPDQRP